MIRYLGKIDRALRICKIRKYIPGTKANLRRRLERIEGELEDSDVRAEHLRDTAQAQYEIIQRLRGERGRLEDEKETFGVERNSYRRAFVGAESHIVRGAINSVRKGYNPITGKKDGRYAFMDRRGNVHLPERAQKLFGLPEVCPYEGLVSGEVASFLKDLEGEKTFERLSVLIREGRRRSIKRVHINPLKFGEIVVGYEIDFQTLGRLEAAADRLADRRRRNEEKDVREEIQRALNDADKHLRERPEPA